MNAYKVWIKGRRFDTETVIIASHKINALIKLANEHGLKSIDCDGLLLKRNVGIGYKA